MDMITEVQFLKLPTGVMMMKKLFVNILLFLFSFARSKRIILFQIKISKCVIYNSVVSFICPYCQNNISHHCTITQLPILNGNFWGRKMGPHWELALVQLGQDVRVCHHSLLLKVSDEPILKASKF